MTSISIHNPDNIYTTGYFRGTTDFNPSDATYNLASTGQYDLFISNFSTIITEIDNPFHKNCFTIYPNPSYDEITIAVPSTKVSQLYGITDQIGREVLNGTIKDLELTLDIRCLAEGFYILRIGDLQTRFVKTTKY